MNETDIKRDEMPLRWGKRLLIGAFFFFFLSLFFYLCSNETAAFSPIKASGSFLLSLIFTGLVGLYLWMRHRRLFISSRHLILLASLAVLTLFFAKATDYFFVGHSGYLVYYHAPLFVPFISILVCLLIGSEAAIFVAFCLTVVLGSFLTVDPTRFYVMNFLTSGVTILATKGIHKRNAVFIVLAKTWIAALPLLLAFSFLYGESYKQLTYDCIAAFGFLLTTSALVACLLPLLESLFHVMTAMRLREYFDPNHELLRRLSLEAPGTYQHSLVVGNLAEIAAHSIGADALFCRVATLYHDIGKLLNPHYFSENQCGGVNMHQLLTPIESAHVIIAHVREGERLARKYRLPRSFIDVIREHHGTSLVSYFYHKEVESRGEEEAKEAISAFRYAGPKPRTKESALIMLVDTIEAASRSMEQVTEESLAEMVNRLVAKKIAEGQFNECPLSFEELAKVKKSLINALVIARHQRVKYPSVVPDTEVREQSIPSRIETVKS